jgi:hypothetical protein
MDSHAHNHNGSQLSNDKERDQVVWEAGRCCWRTHGMLIFISFIMWCVCVSLSLTPSCGGDKSQNPFYSIVLAPSPHYDADLVWKFPLNSFVNAQFVHINRYIALTDGEMCYTMMTSLGSKKCSQPITAFWVVSLLRLRPRNYHKHSPVWIWYYIFFFYWSK